MQDAQAPMNMCARVIVPGIRHFAAGNGGRIPHPGREKVGRWNEQSALQAMCDAEKDWHERSFRASGAFGGRQNLPFNKPEISFSFFIFQPAVHYD